MTSNAPGPADNLVLIGPMGSGKSSVARELARMTSRRWIDTDRQIVQGTGRTIADIFAHEGEEYFRGLETETLETLANERRLVIATGGGIVTRPENQALLRALGCVTFLTAEVEVLFERVSRSRHRPLLQTADPRAVLEELICGRQPLYTACANLVVDTSVGTHADVARLVLAGAREFFAGAGQAGALP